MGASGREFLQQQIDRDKAACTCQSEFFICDYCEQKEAEREDEFCRSVEDIG